MDCFTADYVLNLTAKAWKLLQCLYIQEGILERQDLYNYCIQT